ncbi:MAG: nodulation protein NfeD [Terriglobia bacterium]
MRALVHHRGGGLLLSLAFLFLPVLPGHASTVVELQLNEIVHPVSADYIVRGLDEAQRRNAVAVLIVLNTPGGLDVSMRKIIDHIIHSPVPVIAYVAPSGARAASAGFFILLAADVAAMAPGTNTGAASPVLLPGAKVDETLKKKMTQDAAAYLRGFVSKRGRNVALAEKAVTEAKSFTDGEALAGKLIDLVAESREALLEKLHQRAIKRFDGRQVTLELSAARLEEVAMTQRERFLTRILDPNIAFLLFVFGILGLYIEFNNPGLILPGVAGGISLVLALFAFHLLPVNYAGVLLIVLAMALFLLEAMYVSHGILATGGVVAMVLGALMLVESPPIPQLQVRWELALAVAIPFAVITVLLLRLVLKSRRWRVATGQEELVGAVGEVRQEISDARKGLVLVAGELWRATASQEIPVGQSVRVVRLEGLILHVKPIDGGSGASQSPEKE